MHNKYAKIASKLLWIEAVYFVFVGELFQILLGAERSLLLSRIIWAAHGIFGLVMPLVLILVGWRGMRAYNSGAAIDGKNRSALALMGGTLVLVLSVITLYTLSWTGFGPK
jgi:membrane protein implicated in regulation of membrane protease activity